MKWQTKILEEIEAEFNRERERESERYEETGRGRKLKRRMYREQFVLLTVKPEYYRRSLRYKTEPPSGQS